MTDQEEQPKTKGPRVHKRVKANLEKSVSGEYFSSTSSMGDMLNPEMSMYIPGSGIFMPSLPADFDTFPTFLDFAKENFGKVKKSGGLFGKKLETEEAILFSVEFLKGSLLGKCDDKKGVKINNFLHSYIIENTELDGNKESLKQLFEYIKDDQILIDEAFIQAVRMTNHTDSKYISKSWQALIFICTVFPASKDIRGVVYKYLATAASSHDSLEATSAQFCYLRFDSRTPSEVIMDFRDDIENLTLDDVVDHLHTDIYEGNHYSCVSLYEMIWSQSRNERVHYPYPIHLKSITNRIIEAGALRIEGPFRLNGSKTTYVQKLKELYNNQCLVSTLNLNDATSLFKCWLRTLPERLIPPAYFDKFIEMCSQEKFIDFAESLPRINRDTLKFVCGFCKKIVAAKEFTKMGSTNVATCVAPNIFSVPNSEIEKMNLGNGHAQNLLTYLIDHWDTTAIYTD